MDNTRENLIELINQADSECSRKQCENCGAFGKGVDCVNHNIADHLIANGVTVQEWISVKERLPEKKGAFLVCTKHDFYGTQNVAKARFCDGEWNGTGGIWSNVTHWMSLPEPPKGEWGI